MDTYQKQYNLKLNKILKILNLNIANESIPTYGTTSPFKHLSKNMGNEIYSDGSFRDVVRQIFEKRQELQNISAFGILPIDLGPSTFVCKMPTVLPLVSRSQFLSGVYPDDRDAEELFLILVRLLEEILFKEGGDLKKVLEINCTEKELQARYPNSFFKTLWQVHPDALIRANDSITYTSNSHLYRQMDDSEMYDWRSVLRRILIVFYIVDEKSLLKASMSQLAGYLNNKKALFKPIQKKTIEEEISKIKKILKLSLNKQ
jgi:hypothetical protein